MSADARPEPIEASLLITQGDRGVPRDLGDAFTPQPRARLDMREVETDADRQRRRDRERSGGGGGGGGGGGRRPLDATAAAFTPREAAANTVAQVADGVLDDLTALIEVRRKGLFSTLSRDSPYATTCLADLKSILAAVIDGRAAPYAG